MLRAPSRASVDDLVAQLEAAAGPARRSSGSNLSDNAAEAATTSDTMDVAPLAPSVQEAAQQKEQERLVSTHDRFRRAFGSPVSQEELDESANAPTPKHPVDSSHQQQGAKQPQAAQQDSDSGVCIPAGWGSSPQRGRGRGMTHRSGGAAQPAPACGTSKVLLIEPSVSTVAKSQVQQLEEAVARLQCDLSASRPGSAAIATARNAGSVGASPARLPLVASAPVSPLASPPERAPRRRLLPPAANVADARAASTLDTLVRENQLLVQQQDVLEAEVCRLHGQLQAAAADNVRLAQEAASAVRALQAAGAGAAEAQQREVALRAELGAAAARCEAAARELSALGPALERKSASCDELRRAADELGRERALLTAALATAQLQLKEATPAGFAAQAKELAAARAELAAAHKQVAEAQAAAAEVRVAAQRAGAGEWQEEEQQSARKQAGRVADANAKLQQENASLAAQVGQARQQQLRHPCMASLPPDFALPRLLPQSPRPSAGYPAAARGGGAQSQLFRARVQPGRRHARAGGAGNGVGPGPGGGGRCAAGLAGRACGAAGRNAERAQRRSRPGHAGGGHAGRAGGGAAGGSSA